MGSCCSTSGSSTSGAAATLSVAGDDGKVANSSISLFDELGIPLLRRPDPDQLHALWYEFDLNQDELLSPNGCLAFLRAASGRWGDASWSGTGGGVDVDKKKDASASAPPRPSEGILSKGEVTWDEMIAELWGHPVMDLEPSAVLLFQREFQRAVDADGAGAAGGGGGKANKKNFQANPLLPKKQAGDLALKLLYGVKTPRHEARRVSEAMPDTGVTFRGFLRIVGPTHSSHRRKFDEGLRDDDEGDLPLDGVIRSITPVRESARYEILNCGEAAITAMWNACKSAESEILMSWWQFCPTLPAVRGRDLGNNAWTNRSGTLPPLLRSKAESGVKVYILLYDIIDNVIPYAPLVEYAIRSLGGAHENIHVASHPGLSTWTSSHHQKFVVVDRAVAILGGVDWTVGRWDTPSHPLFDPHSAVHPGLELHSEDGRRLDEDVSDFWTKPQRDLRGVDRGEHGCNMWQDATVCVRGEAASDVALTFIRRWGHVRWDVVELIGAGLRDGMPSIPPRLVLPKGKSTADVAAAGMVISDSPSSLTVGGFPSPGAVGVGRCQIVQSIGRWSGGVKTDTSHYEAWISAINSAEDFVYVEQQYFVCNMGEGGAKNRVAEAILLRVKRAIEKSKPFRVYVVIPETVEASLVNYFTRRTLLQDGRDRERRELCLMTRIRLLLKSAAPGSYWDGKKAEMIMSVCTLASVGKSASGRWDVGGIFVHSKVLIVDDRIAVIGSANVNDRSFVGNKDSEIGAILWDDPSQASEGTGGIQDFRLRLWRRYLGLSLDGAQDGDIADPASTQTFSLWTAVALRNLDIITTVFDHTPRDSITSMKEYNEAKAIYQMKTPEQRGMSLSSPEKLNQVQGQLMKYPPKFLSDQDKRSALDEFIELVPWLKAEAV